MNLGNMFKGIGPTKHPEMKDIYWTAGIYEGEGSCIYTSGTQKVSVSQKEKWILVKLQEFFGGSICPKQSKSGCYTWQLTGPRARGLVMTLYPMLSPHRQEQIRRALNGKSKEA